MSNDDTRPSGLVSAAAGNRVSHVAKSLVVVLYDASGAAVVHIEDNALEFVRVLTIDERAQNDRVYEMTQGSPREELEQIIGDSPIGSRFDQRHAAIANRIKSRESDQRHLRSVDLESSAPGGSSQSHGEGVHK